jgi:hypothetical protein
LCGVAEMPCEFCFASAEAIGVVLIALPQIRQAVCVPQDGITVSPL